MKMKGKMTLLLLCSIFCLIESGAAVPAKPYAGNVLPVIASHSHSVTESDIRHLADTTTTTVTLASDVVLYLDSHIPESLTAGATKWSDLSGNGNHIGWSVSAAPEIVKDGSFTVVKTTPTTQALRAMCSTKYVNGITGSQSYTVVSVFKPNTVDTGDGKALFSMGKAEGTCSSDSLTPISIGGWYKFTGGVCGSNDQGTWLDGSGASPTATDYFHMVTTYDGTTESVYINGKLDKSKAAQFSIPDSDNNRFCLNNPSDDALEYNSNMDANVALIIVLNRALSEKEVLQSYQAYFPTAWVYTPIGTEQSLAAMQLNAVSDTCQSDEDCKGNTEGNFVCNLGDSNQVLLNKCVQCLASSSCGANQVCNETTLQCQDTPFEHTLGLRVLDLRYSEYSAWPSDVKSQFENDLIAVVAETVGAGDAKDFAIVGVKEGSTIFEIGVRASSEDFAAYSTKLSEGLTKEDSPISFFFSYHQLTPDTSYDPITEQSTVIDGSSNSSGTHTTPASDNNNATPTTTTESDTIDSDNTALIVGVVVGVGGFLLLVCVGLTLWFRCRRSGAMAPACDDGRKRAPVTQGHTSQPEPDAEVQPLPKTVVHSHATMHTSQQVHVTALAQQVRVNVSSLSAAPIKVKDVSQSEPVDLDVSESDGVDGPNPVEGNPVSPRHIPIEVDGSGV
eukprot:GDKI01015321.1.p1 GENE.GDKI01015321.1~~GDKI01015321.1.p1  ORF type:complete len:674 (-),score=176.85 GDKI01015321.1:143-2164(-)